jgi:hypothetical protein
MERKGRRTSIPLLHSHMYVNSGPQDAPLMAQAWLTGKARVRTYMGMRVGSFIVVLDSLPCRLLLDFLGDC